MEELLLPLKRPIKAAVKDQQAGLGALGCGAGKGEGGVGSYPSGFAGKAPCLYFGVGKVGLGPSTLQA